MRWPNQWRYPRRLLVLAWGFCTCAIILVGAASLLRVPAPVADDLPPTTVPRQQVVIFLVDTQAYFETHGAYVQSVLQQQCAACRLRLVNLHGDLSLLSLSQALQYIAEESRTYEAHTSVLVNLSLGTYVYDAGLHASVRALEALGIPMIASAGNDNVAKPFYPAAFPEVFGVCSSTRHTRAKAAYSNFGPWVSLCAPGLQLVSRPLQHGELASGTSFASPVVAGVLGRLLLDTPCASPRAGLRALRRTAEPLASAPPALQAGVLQEAAAGQYLRSLYPCQSGQPAGYGARLLAGLHRLSSHVAFYLGLVLYFLVSIFAFPFFLAFLIDRLEQRAARRAYQVLLQVYAGTPEYRQQRLAVLQQRWARRQRVRRRDRAELTALLHALHLYGEPCGWCGRPAAAPLEPGWVFEDSAQCSRCGWDLMGRQPPTGAGGEDDATPV